MSLLWALVVSIWCFTSLTARCDELGDEQLIEELIRASAVESKTSARNAPIEFKRKMGFVAHEITLFKPPCREYDSEQCARRFLIEYDAVFSRNIYFRGALRYASRLDISNKNKQDKVMQARLKITTLLKAAKKEARKFHFKKFSPAISRQFQRIARTTSPKDPAVSKKAVKLAGELVRKYSSANVCVRKVGCLGEGERPMETFMAKERNYDRLADAWKQWNDIQGGQLKPIYKEFVKYSNIGPRENGYKDAGHAEWLLDMEDPNFDSYVWKLFEELKPLYRELHAYVRARLRKHYPNRFAANDPIPAHILGNVWAQQWTSIYSLVKPFPNITSTNIDGKLQAMTMKQIVRMAEDFFTSLGLAPMTKDFWRYSVFEQVPNRVMDCHASAQDMGNGVDFRIRMCGIKGKTTFQTIHHEMGHIQYYMEYAPQPLAFRGGANSGFHEAIGDTIALSVMTPEHLKRVGLLHDVPTNEEYDINYQMYMALHKIAFYPFGLLCDVFRWRVFNGTVKDDHYNREWWKLRMELQGIMPPVKRDESTADALSKYHIAVNVPYIRYFLSYIMQFQFYEALCKASGYNGPLHRCDFYKSKAAGDKLSAMLRMGKSKPWQEAMKVMTGKPHLSTKSLRNYFKPLYKWLKRENARLKNPIGWKIRNDLVGN